MKLDERMLYIIDHLSQQESKAYSRAYYAEHFGISERQLRRITVQYETIRLSCQVYEHLPFNLPAVLTLRPNGGPAVLRLII